MLYIPGGGFVSNIHNALPNQYGHQAGFDVKRIDYTLNDPLTAWKEVKQAALKAKRSGRKVIAYGESAGGVFASRLAELGFADRAVANAPPSNLTNWNLNNDPNYWNTLKHHGMETRKYLSPAFHKSMNPILVQQSASDVVTPYNMNRRWAARDQKVGFQSYQGGHVLGDNYTGNLTNAMTYLRKALKRRI